MSDSNHDFCLHNNTFYLDVLQAYEQQSDENFLKVLDNHRAIVRLEESTMCNSSVRRSGDHTAQIQYVQHMRKYWDSGL